VVAFVEAIMSGNECDVAVIGGGLAGLAAAGLLARRGLDVVVLERATELGGRAATHVENGFYFNEGAHALYVGGAAGRVLDRLGVQWSGKRPPLAGLAVLEDRAYALPSTLGSLLTTGLLGWPSKLQGAKLFARLGGIDTAALAGVTWRAWSERHVPDAAMRATLDAFVRVSTYASAPSMSAGAVIDQLRLAQRLGVAYVDGGWATLVQSAATIAVEAGARLHTSAHVDCATVDRREWIVSTRTNRRLRCRAIILATGPAAARSIVSSDVLATWGARAIPVRAACLDVALRRLPDERATFALGVDRPLYLSVHSKTARLAPEGAALVSVMKYLPPGEAPEGKRDEVELGQWLDLLQPGWRNVLLRRRWLPAMVVSHALVTAEDGGLPGRPGPRVPDAPGVFVAGDWVGPEGMLLDASLASAERAADALADDLAVAKVA
jgi:phytoene dehydrogenase-like protein